jgi:AcrR family transcriptional regulator
MQVAVDHRRPGAARSESARAAILKAASDLIKTEGYDHLTIEGIAARAKVGKPTIYRWWASKSALIAECLVNDALLPDVFPLQTTDDIVEDITEWFREVVRFTSVERNAALIRSLVAAAADNREVGEQLTSRLGAHPDSLDGRLAEGVRLGQLAPDTSVTHLRELLIGVIIVRAIGGQELTDDDAVQFVRIALSGSLQR